MTDRKAWQHHDSSQSRHARGYGAAWVKLRAQVLKRDGHLCQECKRQGRATVATEVHHVTPKARGGSDDPGNLLSICHPCHVKAGLEERGARPRQQIGADGWPIE